MKKVIFFSALAIVLGAVLLRLLQHDPGYVLIVAWGKTIEMRLGFALLLLAVAVFFAAFSLRIFVGGLRFLKRHWQRTVNAGALKKQRKAEQGLYHILEGDWALGKRVLLQAAKAEKQSQLPLLAAARCAQAMGDYEAAKECLERVSTMSAGANTKAPSQLAALIIKAQVHFDEKEYAACLSVLNRAKALSPNSLVVLTLLHQAYEATNDWLALEALMPELERNRAYSPEQLASHKNALYFSRLGAFGLQLEALNKNEVVTSENGISHNKESVQAELDLYWKRLPKDVKNTPKFIERYCQLLLLLGESTKVEALIRTVLKNHWDDALVLLYGVLNEVDAKRQLVVANEWFTLHPEDAVLQLTLGRLCLRNQLWGQAKEHFQHSLRLNPSAVVFAELARLLAYLGDADSSLEVYKKGLLQATEGLPNLPMPKN